MTTPTQIATQGMSAGRIALLASAAAYAVLVVWQAFTLPPTVPARIGYANDVSRWGTLTEHVLFASGLGVFVLVLFLLLPGWTARMPAEWVNMPHKAYWMRPENRPRATRLMQDACGWMGTVTLVLLAGSLWTVGRVAVGEDVPDWVMPMALVAYSVWMLAYGVQATLGRRWRPPASTTTASPQRRPSA